MRFELILFLFLQLSPVPFNTDFIVMLHTQWILAIANNFEKNNQSIIEKRKTEIKNNNSLRLLYVWVNDSLKLWFTVIMAKVNCIFECDFD